MNKFIKTAILCLMLSGTAQADIFDATGSWFEGIWTSVSETLNPCDKIHGCLFGWDDVPSDWRERKDRSGHF